MRKYLIDTNVLVRLLVRDSEEGYKRALGLFSGLDGKSTKGVIHPLVVAELVYVLTSPKLYGYERTKVRDVLVKLFNSRVLIIAEKVLIFQALRIFALRSLDFVDCYLITKKISGGYRGVLSMDKKVG